MEVERTPGAKGQFDVLVDGERVVTRGGNFLTRQWGAGYPDEADAVERVRARLG